MAIIPFCTFLPVLKKTVTHRNQEQIRSRKPSLNHGRRIKTILGQFRNKHARYGEFSTYFKSFTDFEKEVLIALAHGKTNPSSMAQETRKPISSLPQILHRLMSHGIVEKYLEGRYRISDPVFSDWLSQRYALIVGD